MITLFVLCAVITAAYGRDHTIVGAKEFRVGATNNVVLNFHGYDGTATVEVHLQTLPRRIYSFADIPATRVDVRWPYQFSILVSREDLVEPNNGDDMYVELHVNVEQSSENFRETIPVLLNFTTGYIFVTTDRPTYRPGDEMLIIAMLTDMDLRENVNVPVEITIKTPVEESGHGKIGVLKAQKMTIAGHFITHRYQIPPEPLLGKWFIEVSALAGIVSGRKRFEISTDVITAALGEGETMEDLVSEGASLTVEVAVTGGAESIYETDIVSDIRFTSSPYLIVTDRSSRYFNPGIVYEVKANVLDSVTHKPINDVPVAVTVGDVVKRPNSDERGEIVASFNRISEAQELQATLTTAKEGLQAEDQYSTTYTALRHQAGALMSISVDTHGVVGQMMNAVFRFESDDVNGDIRYYIVSKGQVVSIGLIPINPGHRGDKTHDIPITHEMIPSARLVAYYMRGNELVSNSVWFDVNDVCGGEELTVTTSVSEARPGDDITINVRGNPNALFHLSAVNRAAYFVYNGSRLTRDVMWNKMQQYDSACSREGGSNNKDVFEKAGLFIVNKALRPTTYSQPICPQPVPRRKRQVDVMVTETTKGRRKFLADCEGNGRDNESGELCLKRKGRFRRSNSAEKVGEAQDRKKRRTNFEENWLFITGRLDNDGEWSQTRPVPGSISTFEFNGFSSSSHGFCVAKPANLLVFENIFIQLYLPHAVRLMEQASIRYSVFNYNPNEIEARVQLRHSEDLCSQFSSKTMNTIATLRVPGNSAKSSYFTVMPIKIPADPKGASIEMAAGSAAGNDFLVKYLLIEPSGLLNESSKTFVLTPPQNIAFSFLVPNDGFEPNTRKCWIYAYANVVGPIATPDPITNRYNNLQNLIHQPAGDGESNMFRTAPIVFIHKYRLATGQVLTGGLEEQQVIDYIRQGWSIQLKWRSHSVGRRAWAIFYSYPPSVWLNAFVDRVFVEARDIMVDLDPAPICSSLVWLMEQQKQDGRFVEITPILYQDMDGLVQGDIAMTAYVTVTLGIAERACPHLTRNLTEAKNDALRFLDDQSTAMMNNTYVTAVTAYGLAMNEGYENLARAWNNRLHDLCTETAQHIYCQSAGGQAGRVETTSYALLAQIALVSEFATEDEMSRVHKMALWLVEQRNSFGGIETTQDTVMALQASAEYMKWIHMINTEPPLINMNVTFSSIFAGADWQNQPMKIALDQSNEVVRHELEVPNNVIGTPVDVNIEGVGEASISYRCTWRENVDGENCQFQIAVTTRLIRDPQDVDDPQTYLNLRISIRKLENQYTNISIVDVGLISGFGPVRQSIDNIERSHRVDGTADRYEISDNSVKFYLSAINEEATVLSFNLRQESIIKDPQPAAITVYDYYNPEISCSKFYALDDRVELRVACNNAAERSQRICKCAEGGCPKCRTREEVATDTKCIILPVGNNRGLRKRRCAEWEETCMRYSKVGCHDSVVEAIERSYLFYVVVTEVRKNQPPNFVEFDAEVLHNPKKGLELTKGKKTFRMRFDCFENCRDIALTKHPNIDVIKPGRNLIIYGNEPQRATNPDGTPSYLYVLHETAIIEVAQAERKCKNLLRVECVSPAAFGTKKCLRKRVCMLHDNLRKMVTRGCG